MKNKLRTLSEVVDWINKDIADHEKEFRDNPPPFVKGAMTALKNLKFFIDIPTTGKQPTNEPILRWVKLETGCKMPDYDKFVLWCNVEGNFFVDAIDKDDPTWWLGTHGHRGICTHWANIQPPDEEPNQDILWDEAIEMLNHEIECPIGIAPYLHPAVKEMLSEKYLITRK